MRYMIKAFCLCLLLGSVGVVAMASHDDIGPMYNAADQTLLCMVHCDTGPCDIRMKILGACAVG